MKRECRLTKTLLPRPFLSDEAHLEIAAGAATLDERLRELRASSSKPVVASEPQALRPWVQAFAASDRDAFERRLLWDGLDAETVLSALAVSSFREPPAWTSWLDLVLEECSRFAGELRGQSSFPEARFFEPDETPPFLELLVPPLRAARRLSTTRHGDHRDALALPASQALERQLARELSVFCELALYERFTNLRNSRYPVQSATEPALAYSTFVDEMLDGGILSLFKDYPVLARQIARLCETWTDGVGELVERLRSDRADLGRTFDGGRDPGPVDSIETEMSDRHHGGRRVAVLRFRSGLRLVYKPRSVGLEGAFNHFLCWLKARGLGAAPPSLAILARDGYGWTAFATEGSFRTRDAVEQYFRKAGSLIAIAYVFRGTDLHLENVVASSEGPLLVDTETLFQPVVAVAAVVAATLANAASSQPTPIEDWVAESCLGTGLLTLLQTDAKGDFFDLGGLRGSGGAEAPIARRRWSNLSTDSLRYDPNPIFRPKLSNRVRLDGVVADVGCYTEDVVAGFGETYRFLLANRDAILAPDGPLVSFEREKVRVLLRTTTQYGALQYVLAAPRYQRAGAHRSFAVDALNRVFAATPTRPLLWPMMVDERASIEDLDIPSFAVAANGTSLRSKSGERVEGYFVRSGVSAVVDRFRELSEAGLEDQTEILKSGLSSSLDSRFHVAPPTGGGSGAFGSASASSLFNHALWIGHEILDKAVPDSQGHLIWRLPPTLGDSAFRNGFASLSLHDGAVGIALFLAALGAAGEGGIWADAARAAIDPVNRFLDEGDTKRRRDAGIGGSTGLGSLVYGLTCIDRLVGGGVEEMAIKAARLIDEEAVSADTRLDVVAGAAGAILALLALNEVRQEPWLLDRARLCGEHLLSRRYEPGPGLVSWNLLAGAGFAHGTAGLAYALACLSRVTRDRVFQDAAAGAYAYERTLFSARHGNWPILGRGVTTADSGTTTMTAWCHGAPGIGLARALARDVLFDARVAEEIEVAMSTTSACAPSRSDHLCCGNLGRADVLLAVGRTVDRPELVTRAEGIAERVTARARERGHFGLPASTFEYPVFTPGFFKGLSGIGYQLLRIAEPDRFPSILGFEVPRPC